MVPVDGLLTLYQQMAHCVERNIAGAYVECGVWHGGSVALAAIAILNHGDGLRDLHLFDSFAGIPEPIVGVDGERAIAEVQGRAKVGQGGELVVAWDYSEMGGPGSPAEVTRLLTDIGYDETRVRIHKGWFQDTVPVSVTDVGPIAILRLDGDWYESTKVCLDHLYRQVVRGGFVIIDDYGAYDGCRLAVNEFLNREGARPFLSPVNEEIVYLVKP